MQSDVNVLQIVLTIFGSVLASSGFWAFLSARSEKKSNKNKLLLGLACDRIVHLGMSYIKRGWITKDEYETLHDYLWLPYQANGGNGTAARVMEEVDKLEIR